jgi:stage II sporulation protein R
MVKRKSFISLKSYYLVAFALIVLIACWESNRTNAAVITPEIPEQSIRLRILANSDAPQDQALKREIRDAIVAQMQNWVTGPHTIGEARAVVVSHLPDLDQLVEEIVVKRGYSYTHKTELGIVPFPTKMYGNKVYPAGDYEALRVTIGEGKGQNWWCVLFPPLCFVDSVSGEAVATTAAVTAKDAKENNQKADTTAKKASSNKESVNKDSKNQNSNNNESKLSKNDNASKGSKESIDSHDATDEAQTPAKLKVKFFIWELIKKAASWF